MKTLNEIIHHDEDILFVDGMVLEDDILFEKKEVKKEPPKDDEDETPTKNDHLDHVEDLIVRHGEKGMDKATSHLMDTHNFLLGKKKEGTSISTKIDGMPSLVFGTDPKSKKFFVGTKSFFNKSPKINYTPKDIDDNHGKTPGLAEKLKLALSHLKKIAPKEGIYQGDMLYASPDVQDNKTHFSFTPNILQYNIKKDSVEGKKIADSKMGIAVHTSYEPGMNGALHAKFGVDQAKFKEHPEVFSMNTNLKGKYDYSPNRQKEFLGHLNDASDVHKRLLNSKGYDNVKDHQKLLLGYINKTVKERKSASPEGYIAYLQNQFKTRVDGLKVEKNKTELRGHLDNEINNVIGKKSSFTNILQLHKHLQNAKNTLLKPLSEKSPYDETLLGNKSKPEGFVVHSKNGPAKLVDRDHFSAANFEWNDKVNPDDKPTVLTWGRMNPPTIGHKKVLDKASEIAKKTGANQVNVATGSKDKTKNPLSPADKMKWLKAMFPGQNIALAGDNHNTIVGQLQHLHHSGVKHLTIVSGDDRIHDYTKILSKYNGHGDEKLFNFKKVRVVSAGKRNSDSSGVEGVSGTKMRGAAMKNDYKTFKKGLPDHIGEKQGLEMFTTLRKELVKTSKGNKHV